MEVGPKFLFLLPMKDDAIGRRKGDYSFRIDVTSIRLQCSDIAIDIEENIVILVKVVDWRKIMAIHRATGWAICVVALGFESSVILCRR